MLHTCCILGKWIQPWTKDHKSISLSKSPQREVISISLSLMRSSRPDVPVGPSFGNSKYLHFPPFPALVFANEEFFGISSWHKSADLACGLCRSSRAGVVASGAISHENRHPPWTSQAPSAPRPHMDGRTSFRATKRNGSTGTLNHLCRK